MNRRRFESLYAREHDRLRCAILGMTRNREVAEDLTAEAFVSALSHLGGFRGRSSFSTWLHAIGANAVNNWRRKKGSNSVSLEIINGETLRTTDRLLSDLESRDQASRVQNALAQIPPVYRRALVDRFLNGYSTKETARRQKVPLGTILSRVSKAKNSLRQKLEVSDAK